MEGRKVVCDLARGEERQWEGMPVILAASIQPQLKEERKVFDLSFVFSISSLR